MMDANWKSVRLRFELSFSVTCLVLLSFRLCSSFYDEGLDLMKRNEDAAKAVLASQSTSMHANGRVYLYTNEVGTDSKAIGLHRKLLVSFYNPYHFMIGNRPATPAGAQVSSAPSPKPIAEKTVPSPEVQKNSSKQDASAPPPSPLHTNEIPQTTSPTPRSSPSSFADNKVAIIVGSISAAVFLILLATGVYFFKFKAGKSVNPWRTGLSGQLQKALLTGVPKLKRIELEAACEDFSNVIGSCPIGTLFKGTLSSGVEIAVASVDATSANDWKNNVQTEFRKKLEMLAKINHKNFVNLLGYCEEEEPFTRIMVFEYAPNGSLFEHLHYKESEHLDWGMRLRIVMGIGYCLEYMHQCNPPIAHNSLLSSSIQLAEDYAVKVADFTFGNLKCPASRENSSNALIDMQVSATTLEDNVHSFGVLVFEMITGKLPDSLDSALAEFLRGETLVEMADPTLESLDEKIEEIGEVIKCCVRTEPQERPRMSDITSRLREITRISPEAAAPKLSPLWWAELEVLSTV